jgi:hypothetical protein
MLLYILASGVVLDARISIYRAMLIEKRRSIRELLTQELPSLWEDVRPLLALT